MTYRMKIISEEPTEIYNHELKKCVKIEVGLKYKCYYEKPTNKKERQEQNRIVEVLGFNDDFMPTGVIVRYQDTMRRGMVCPSCLIPHEE